MRLADFILENIEPIVVEWVDYARSIWPDVSATPEELRDHVQEMLLSVAAKMADAQSAIEQKEESLGRGEDRKSDRQLDDASREHAEGRSDSGFDLQQLVSEYRALRASVIRLWKSSAPEPHSLHLEDVAHFNEAIDQLLAESVIAHSKRLDRSRELFLGILGHDLRNPLSTVLGLSEMLRDEKLDSSSLELASQITSRTNAMIKLVEDLLEFAAMRIPKGFILSRGPVDLVPLCREAVADMEKIYRTRDFRFEHQGNLDGDWDEPRLKQMISNLIGNAAQHGAKDQPIYVSIKATDDDVVLEFRNQGIPIPADQLKTLFQPMKRYATGKGRGSHGGVGLGLYIAHEVATAHGGSIVVRSDKQGTVFTVGLPRVACRP